MPKMRRISGDEMIAILCKMGFRRIRQKGSHVILKKQNPDGEVGCVVPLHKVLAIGTLFGILKQGQVEQEEFFKYL